jgi:UPF0716 protein FxsA
MAQAEKQTRRRRPFVWAILLLALIAMPLAEIAVFIQVGGLIGLWPTLALIVLSAVIGIWILRLQGIGLLDRARRQLDRGAVPVFEVFSGACLILAGALLLTPGFITDAVGALLLVPPVRALLYGLVRDRLVVHAETRLRARGTPPPGATREGRVIEGEYEEVGLDGRGRPDDDRPMPPPRGGWEPPR